MLKVNSLRSRIDTYGLAAILFVIGVVSRIPFRSSVLLHWDSVNFALALEHYDVRMHQPHPPGYFLYVMMGRAVQFLISDGNAALVWLSLVASALGVVALYVLGAEMFDQRVGIISAALTLTSPLVWFHGEVALSYAVEFTLVTILATLGYRQLQGERRWWLWTALLLGVVGGVRQNTLVLLLPLWLACLWPLRWRKRFLSLAVLGTVMIGWFVPMIALSGGFDGYRAALRAATMDVARESSLLAPAQLTLNASRMALYLGYGLLLAILPLAWVVWQAARRWRTLVRDRRAWVMALWISPPLVFYVMVHLRQHGHIFTFMPAVLLLAGWGVVRFSEGMHRQPLQRVVLIGVAAALLLVNVAFFLGAPASLLGSQRLPLQTPGWQTIRQRDQYLGARITAIRDRFDPANTAVWSKGMYFRHPDYYFRDFHHPGLGHDVAAGPVLLDGDVKTLVLFDAGAELASDPKVLSYVPLADGEYLAYIQRPAQYKFVVSQDAVCLCSVP